MGHAVRMFEESSTALGTHTLKPLDYNIEETFIQCEVDADRGMWFLEIWTQ